jgi:hypothetical protein
LVRWGALLPGDQPLAQLSITITAGANTVQEKTDWQHEAWKLLRAIWDDSVLPNYVSVVELPGTDWVIPPFLEHAKSRG